ncbi:signal peptide peptidase SppA [Alloprevotella rava F0323]|uniref:Signal peptide peptidase SppA n=1 Tax=Alloprevotella rava F0323 TaxID=679199 RepID=G5GBL9_9BACT|nr:signal peptide peptidase SppA [Alloprevotella rava]EHG23218.1 signal peptide peptidase SppA [Alloprevotella rava F0323]
MKDFFKYVLATIVGIMLVGIFSFFMGLMMLVSLALSSNQKPMVEDNSILRISLSGTISERATSNPWAIFFSDDLAEQQGLDDIIKAIKVAGEDEDIKGIYIEGGMLQSDFATLQELRKALSDFKESGKFIIAYGESYTQGAYYVASVADKVLVNPNGMLDWHGLSSQPVFYKDLMEKVGVKMQIFRVGTYKSAVEPYMLSGMSPANREMMQSMLNNLWGNICKEVSASRRISTDSLNAYADRYQALAEPTSYVKQKLVDGLAYIDEVRQTLRNQLGGKKVNLVEASELAKLYDEGSSSSKIVVYYASGEIFGAEGNMSGLNGEQIIGKNVVEDLDALANDKKVKAVVLRVNSPGGSAYASEQIWHAVELLKKNKPVIVSMGGYAASGGYYISCGADYIISEPTTLTGSIGIFGMVPDASGLLEGKLGLHFDAVSTNKAYDLEPATGHLSPAAGAAMQAYVDRGYKLFISRVAAGRHMTVQRVNEIGQGRVWTGQQALALKLVDRLGTLDDAIAEAAKRAKLIDYEVIASDIETDFFSSLLSNVQEDYLERKLKTVLGTYYDPLRFAESIRGRDVLQARMFFEPNLK